MRNDLVPLADRDMLAKSVQNVASMGGGILLSGLFKIWHVNAAELTLPECSDSIVILRNKEGRQVVLIGTAHISEESVKLVRRTIQTVKPDLVMIELDRKRIGKVGDSKSLEDMGIEIPLDQQQVLQTETSPQMLKRTSLFSQVSSAIGGSIFKVTQQAAGAVVGKALSQFYKVCRKVGVYDRRGVYGCSGGRTKVEC